MRLKSIFYDLGGVNEALLLLFQAASPVASWLAWLVSAVGSYWVAPLVLSAMAWRASRTRDARQAGLLGCQIRRFIFAGIAASVLTWLLKGALSLPRPFSILGMAVGPIGELPTTGSFPSGHSVYVAVLAATLWPPASARMRFGLTAFVIAVGWSRARARHALLCRRGRWMAAWPRLCRAVPAHDLPTPMSRSVGSRARRFA